MAILRRAIALNLLVAVLVVACQPEGQAFQTTLESDDNKPLPVTLTDTTTLVTGIAQAAVEPATIGNDPAVGADQDDPNGLVLTWLGGECDQDAAVRFGPQDGKYVLSLAIHGKPGLGCPAAGVPRAIRIATSSAIPVASIIVPRGFP